MPKYKMIIAYDGTHYCGWQIQPNTNSIQYILQTALYTILRETITLVGSARTDSGVHATGQVAHFSTSKDFDLRKTLYSLNSILPEDIQILSLEPVEETFHALFSAKRKIYHYHISFDPSPFTRFYSYHVRKRIDLSLLEEGASFFVGTHDFTSFANQAHLGSAARNPVKTIYRITIKKEDGGLRLEFEGNGFLYKMIRNIVGTLLDVGSKKILPSDIEKIFSAKDRKKASRAAPPLGLFLHQVIYQSSSKDSK